MKIYACKNIDKEVLKKSSSGGVFYELAKYTIESGGIVFGAAFDKDFNVFHTWTDKIEEIEKFMTSKYAQSNMMGTFDKVRDFLKDGKRVLFSGTPCQVGALKKFLNGNTENLILVDFICHGIPENWVWEKYLKERKGKKEIKKVNFRNKDKGWVDFSLKIEYTDGTFYQKSLDKDLYMRGFLEDFTLRESCYQCQFKGDNHIGDIMLADCWGASNYVKKIDNIEQGVSAVLIRNDVGEEIWNHVKNRFVFEKIELEVIKQYNGNYEKSVQRPDRKDIFIKDYEVKGQLVWALRKNSSNIYLKKLANVIKRVKKKLLAI